MKRQKKLHILKRLFCLTFAIICIASNLTLAFAALEYDSTMHTNEDLFDMDDDGPLIMARLGGDGYNIDGDAIGDDGNVVLDNSNKTNFTVTNYDNSTYRMLFGIEYTEEGNREVYGYSHDMTLNDGKVYYLEVIKEEMNLKDLKITNDNNMSGRFNFIGEYTLRTYDDYMDTKGKITVSIQGDVINYFYRTHGEYDNVHLGFDYIADNNQAIININGERQIKKVAPFDYGKEDLGSVTIDFGLKILNAEFDVHGGEVTPAKVTVVAATSVALATTGSVALSSVSGASGDILDLGKAENDETTEDVEEEEDINEPEDQKEETDFSFIVNNNESLPPLCNSKGATVTIPLCIKDGEGYNWRFSVIPFPVRPDIFVPSIINTVDDTSELSVFITGKKLEENSTSIYCYVNASSVTDEEEKKVQETIEFTLYNSGLYAKVKDNNKNLTKENLSVTYVRDSKIKGNAELITLKNNEYNIEIVEETDTVLKAMIIAVNKEWGSYMLELHKG